MGIASLSFQERIRWGLPHSLYRRGEDGDCITFFTGEEKMVVTSLSLQEGRRWGLYPSLTGREQMGIDSFKNFRGAGGIASQPNFRIAEEDCLTP